MVIFLEPRLITACDIHIKLPKTSHLPHPVGIVIGGSTKIGQEVEIRQNVTLGAQLGDNSSGQPTIMNNVKIYAGAAVLGDITLHEGCIVGANSVVLNDVEAGETVVGSPATRIQVDEDN